MTNQPQNWPADEDWRARYEKTNRRLQVMSVVTAGCAVVALIAVGWGVTRSASNPGNAALASNSRQFGMGGSGQLPPGGSGGPAGMNPASQLFNSDGSVNSDRVEQLVQQMPPAADPTRMVDDMLSRGAITDSQAAELRSAIESATTGGTPSNQPGGA